MPETLESIAFSIVRRLRDAGFTALYAGGCVRDVLLGLVPHDYDIATDARPEQARKLFPHTYAVGAHFGVVVVHEGGHDFQVATFRSDHAYVDGRRPEGVTFSTPRMDAERRDFTMNGLFFDPIKREIIDYVEGRRDLKARLDHLSSQLLNLSIKLDRLLDTGESKPAIRRAKKPGSSSRA